MGKRQIAAQETRRKIIAAAEKLIREKGFEAVGVSDIAKEAGVAKGSFYTYFKRKEDVVAEIAHNKFVSVEKRAKSAGDVCEQISSCLIESVHYIVDTGVNICQQWLKNVVEPADELGKGKLGYDTGVIRRTLLGAVESGELRAETPTESLAESVAAFYYGAVTVWAITDGKADPVKLMENYSTGAEMNNGAVITNTEKNGIPALGRLLPLCHSRSGLHHDHAAPAGALRGVRQSLPQHGDLYGLSPGDQLFRRDQRVHPALHHPPYSRRAEKSAGSTLPQRAPLGGGHGGKRHAEARQGHGFPVPHAGAPAGRIHRMVEALKIED